MLVALQIDTHKSAVVMAFSYRVFELKQLYLRSSYLLLYLLRKRNEVQCRRSIEDNRNGLGG